MVMKVGGVNQMAAQVFNVKAISYDNVFSEERRKRMIRDVKPLLYTKEEWSEFCNNTKMFPGKQTPYSLHKDPNFYQPILELQLRAEDILKQRLEVVGSWINLTWGKKKDICWHTHTHSGVKYSVVYYIKQKPWFSNGTMFRMSNGQERIIRTKQNSMLLFDSTQQHTAPSSPIPFERYTLAMDLRPKLTISK